ncbi:MAG: hypothetical protein WBL23_00170 [Salinisphaera sp.]|uniref:hypothetical protein n=1 Tax=Salinisphaera sp. TaxID=1914330 RepID=UPI003C7BA6BE
MRLHLTRSTLRMATDDPLNDGSAMPEGALGFHNRSLHRCRPHAPAARIKRARRCRSNAQTA